MNTAKKIYREERYVYEDYIKWEDSENWEIIGGKAYAMAPSPTPKHQIIAANIIVDIKKYLNGKTCKVMGEVDVVFSDEDILKPDIIVVCDKNKITENNIKGSPDFIIEILSKSTAKKDKTIKLEKYMEYGVKEYWIVDPFYDEIKVYKNGESSFKNYDMDNDFIPVGIFNDDLKINLKTIFEEE